MIKGMSLGLNKKYSLKIIMSIFMNTFIKINEIDDLIFFDKSSYPIVDID